MQSLRIGTNYDDNSKYFQFVFNRNKRDLFRLMYVCKFHGIDHKKLPVNLVWWIEKNFTDANIVELLKLKINKNNIEISERNRGKKRVLDIFELFTKVGFQLDKQIPPFTTYLDIGAGDCEITNTIAKSLNIEEKNTYALDVESWSNKDNASNGFKNYTYVELPKNDDSEFNHGFEENTFDIITLFQTLHHIKNYKTVINEVYKITKPGGVIIIREHDANDLTTKALCHIEHLIYSIFADKMRISDFFKEYYGNYHSKKEMVQCFVNAGFIPLVEHIKDNPTKYYYQMFKK